MQRPEIYDGHASIPFKEELEEAARSRQTSVDQLLEQIVREWLERDRERPEDDEESQQRLRAAAKQERHAELVDKSFRSSLTETEQTELLQLQEDLDKADAKLYEPIEQKLELTLAKLRQRSR